MESHHLSSNRNSKEMENFERLKILNSDNCQNLNLR